jgi:hypothetical protein
MAVLIQQTMAAAVPLSMIEAVTEDMGVEASPPDGMISHVHYEKDGRVHIVDVWDSPEAHQRFVESRLMPSMGKVAAANGFDIEAAGPPDTVVTDVTRAVRGA